MRERLARLALYAGGFLGPFAGGVPTSMLPELGADFDVSPQVATYSLTAYLVPFAALMLFSGALGSRWGAQRAVRVAYLVYVVASVVCVLAPAWWPFLAARAAQGAANAFTTPLLLAAVAAITPPDRLGRALGLFASMQAAGQTSAPLLGGLAAEVDWRLAFVVVGVVALGLAVVGLPGDLRREGRATVRSAWRPRVLRAGAVALVGWSCLGGLSFLVAIRLGGVFGLGAAERGLLLTGFGVVGLLTARLVGQGVDRVGPRRAVVAGVLLGAVPVLLVGVLPSVAAIAVLWASAGVFSQLLLVGLNAMALSGGGPDRGGAVSVVQAFRFIGGAVSPMVFGPLYAVAPVLAFALPAALLVAAAPVTPGQERPGVRAERP
ncbi:MFS transporter, partial [Actinokineospora bangkokensis]